MKNIRFITTEFDIVIEFAIEIESEKNQIDKTERFKEKTAFLSY